MHAMAQPWALTVDRILEHAAAARPRAEIFTASAAGPPSRTTYAELAERVHRLAGALAADGVRRGDVVAVIGASGARQLEAWYAVTGLGAVCHPINPALPPERLAALLAQGSPKAVFVDASLLPQLEPALQGQARLARVVVMAEREEPFETRLPNAASHDELIAQAGALAWPSLDETAPAVMAHTAGPGDTGRAVTWPHRACVLQAMSAAGPQGLGLTDQDTVLPLVPFWRAAAWGLVFAAPMAGAKLVLPGAKTDPQSIRVLADRESASLIVGSPRDLQALHDQYRAENRSPNGLKRLIAVGAPCPASLAKAWRDNFGVETRAAWGLAETASAGAVFKPGSMGEAPPFGLELKIVGHDGQELPHDGASVGRLRARGASVAAGAGPDGFVDTGDLASIDADGRVRVLGRADALVFAAGGMAPSELIEAAAMDHPATAMAAAIDALSGSPQDGPLLVVCRKAGVMTTKPELLRFLGGRLGPATPKEIVWVDGFPLDQAGRVDRAALRERLQHLGPQTEAPEPAPPEPEPSAFEPPILAEPAPAFAEPPSPTPAFAEAPAPTLAAPAAAGEVLYLPEQAPDPRLESPEPAPPEPIAAEPEPPAPMLEPAPPAALQAEEPPDALEPPAPAGFEDEAPAPPVAAAAASAIHAPAEPPPSRSTALALLPGPAMVIGADAALEDDHRPLRIPGAPRVEADSVVEPVLAPPRRRGSAIWAQWLLSLTAILAGIPLVVCVGIAIGLRVGLIDWRTGLTDLVLDTPYRFALVGLVGGLIAIFAALFAGFGRFWRRALFSLASPMAVLGGLIWLSLIQQSYPPVHEVATDWSDPIRFSPTLTAARGPAANPVEADPVIPADGGRFMNRRVADVNADTCPGAHTVVLPLAPGQAYDRAKAAVKSQGLSVLTDDPRGGRLEATGTNLWLGLRSDLAVRVRPQGQETRIDFRASSREVPADFGANCDAVSRLVQLVQGAS